MRRGGACCGEATHLVPDFDVAPGRAPIYADQTPNGNAIAIFLQPADS